MSRDERIAFMGASGTGKTTLARFLSEHTELPMIPVGSRSVSKAMGFDSPYDVDIACLTTYQNMLDEDPRDTQNAADIAMDCYDAKRATCRALFQTRLQREKIEWETVNDNFISDRTSLDDMCYTIMHDREAVDQAFIDRAHQHMSRYTLIFFAPLGVFQDTSGDNARVRDLVYHEIFEALMTGYCMRWPELGGPTVVITKGSLIERQNEVLAHVLLRRAGVKV